MRKVGKIWLQKEIGSHHFERLAYLNLEHNSNQYHMVILAYVV